MHINYTITNDILNKITKFFELNGRIQALLAYQSDDTLLQDLKSYSQTIASISAVTTDSDVLYEIYPSIKTDLYQILTNEQIADKKNYEEILNNIDKLLPTIEEVDNDKLSKIHALLLSLQSTEFRTHERVIPIEIRENSISTKINYTINTKPDEIEYKLTEFFLWLKSNNSFISPLILSALVHFYIAEIHPFEDGNGRVAKVLTRATLSLNNIDKSMIFPLEVYYLKNQNQYFDLIESTINTGDLTQWIDFFVTGILDATIMTTKLIKKYTANSINPLNLKIINLDSNELKILKAIQEFGNPNGAELGRHFGITRQYVNIIAKKLLAKDLIKKIGDKTNIRYMVN
jgi:Fic family protein